MSEIQGPTRTFTAGGTIVKFDRVALSSGNVVAADADDIAIGNALSAATSGDSVTVLLANAQGTRTCVAAGAISVGDDVFNAASGQVDNVASDDYVGVALTAATAANDEIEVLTAGSVGNTGAIKFIEQTIAYTDFTDGGATAGTLDLTTALPAGALVLGWQFVGTAGFAGDTSATLQAGVSGDADRFSEIATGSVFATATVGSNAPAGSANAYCSAATTVRLTVTSASDFTSVSAGAGTFRMAYIEL